MVLTWHTIGGCSNASASVSINVTGALEQPVGIAGPAISACAGVASEKLGASFGGSAVGGRWSGQGAGTISDSRNGNARFTPAFSQKGSTVVLRWDTFSSNGLWSNVTTSVRVPANPVSSISHAPTKICVGETTGVLGANLNLPDGGVWIGYGNGSIAKRAPNSVFAPHIDQAGTNVTLGWFTDNGCGQTALSYVLVQVRTLRDPACAGFCFDIKLGSRTINTCAPPADEVLEDDVSVVVASKYTAKSFDVGAGSKVQVTGKFNITGTLKMKKGSVLQVNLTAEVSVKKIDAGVGAKIVINKGGKVVVLTAVVSKGGEFVLSDGGSLEVQGDMSLGNNTVFSYFQQTDSAGGLVVQGTLSLQEVKLYVALLKSFATRKIDERSGDTISINNSTGVRSQTVLIARMDSLEGILSSTTASNGANYTGRECDVVQRVRPNYQETSLSVTVQVIRDTSLPGCANVIVTEPGLSAGALAGIIVGCIIIAAVLIVGAIMFLRKMDKSRAESAYMNRLETKVAR